MYRVSETGKRSKNIKDLDDAVDEANIRISDWPKPWDDLRNHPDFRSFKRYGVSKLEILSGTKTTTVTVERTWP